MNEFASLPWYVRHGTVAAGVGAFALVERGWLVALVTVFASLVVTIGGQAALDGTDPSKW